MFYFFVILGWCLLQFFVGLCFELWMNFDFVFGQVVYYIDVVEGMGIEGVFFGYQLFLQWCLGRIQGIVVVDGFFVGEEESSFDVVVLQGLFDEFGLGLVVGIEGEVDFVFVGGCFWCC